MASDFFYLYHPTLEQATFCLQYWEMSYISEEGSEC